MGFFKGLKKVAVGTAKAAGDLALAVAEGAIPVLVEPVIKESTESVCEFLNDLVQEGREREALIILGGIAYAGGLVCEPDLKDGIEDELKAGWKLADQYSLCDWGKIADATLLNVKSVADEWSNRRMERILDHRSEPQNFLEAAMKRAEAASERARDLGAKCRKS